MKRLFKWLKWFCLVGLLLLVLTVLARNFLVRQLAPVAVRQVTGFRLAIESVNIGWGNVHLHNLRMLNPVDFPEPAFVELPRLQLDYEVKSLLALRPHVRQLHIQVQDLVLVTDEKGQTNLERLNGPAKPGGASSSRTEPPADKNKLSYTVDAVNVQVGTVRYVDYSKGEPRERKMVLNLSLQFANIDENTDLSALIFGSVLRNVKIPELKGVTDSLAGQLGGVGETLQKSGDGLRGLFKKK